MYRKAVEVGLGVELDLGPAVPSDIDVLYVVGLGDDSPLELFEAHRDSGRLAVLAPGTATNTVDGAPAADLGRAAAFWRRLVTKSPFGESATQRFSQAISRHVDRLGPLPGGELNHDPPARALVTCLWPALWGHALKNFWGLNQTPSVGLWASHHLLPEGPLAPVRIADQPYGVLPVTSLRDWKAANDDPTWMADVLPSLVRGRDLWAAAAEAEGNIGKADTQRLLDLLGRVPLSRGYAYRTFFSLELCALIYSAFGGAVSLFDLQKWWQDLAGPVLGFPVNPQRRYTSFGWPEDLRLPLVTPTNLNPQLTFEDVIKRLVGAAPRILTNPGLLRELFLGELPDSLLIRLLLLSLILTSSEVGRAANNVVGPLLEPMETDASQLTEAAKWGHQATSQALQLDLPEVVLYHAVRSAALELAKWPVPVLERVMRGTLDTAAYRLDPWVMGFAWHRLEESAKHEPRYLLGAYGWLDRPATGNPGPTEGGLLLAPSEAQALTAAILRDKAIHDPQAGRWDINLESRSIRLAARLGDEVRLGSHLREVLGREVERVVAEKATIEALRKAFPLRPEHDGRRTCDGEAVLKADPLALPLSAAQRQALDPIRRAIDAYGDLLVAEDDVVQGRSDVAAAAMEAAAGLSQPPKLEVIRTRRIGRSVESVVVIVLPDAADPAAGPLISAASIADPAVAAFIRARLGNADGAAWSWRVVDGDGVETDVFLDDLSLEPADAVAFSIGELEGLLLGLQPGAERFDPAASPGRDTHARARHWMDILGSQPATPGDLGIDDPPNAAALLQELIDRYRRLRDAGQQLVALLTASLAGSQADRQIALSAALRWGISPLRLADPIDPGVVDVTIARATRARDALVARLTSPCCGQCWTASGTGASTS